MPWSMKHVKQTYCCNKELLKYFRESRGWTQSQLAQIAGYTDRLISKAEAGQSISSNTIADIADALTTEDTHIFPEDLISDPVQYARQYTDALYIHQKNMVKHIEPFLDENVEFHINGDPEMFPFAGVHRGIDGVKRLVELFFSILEVPENHDHRKHYEYISQGNDVVVWGDTWIHPIGHPMESPIKITQLFKFRCGKLILFDDLFDTQAGAEVLKKSMANQKE